MNDAPIARSPSDDDLDPGHGLDVRDELVEATELNQLLDGLGIADPVKGEAAWRPALTLLAEMDARTPDADAAFVASLRARLIDPAPYEAPSTLSSRRLGIVVAYPIGPTGAPLPWSVVHKRRRVLTAVAAFAAVLLALVQFEPTWLDGSGHSFGVPTAMASTTAVEVAATITPTALPTADHVRQSSQSGGY